LFLLESLPYLSQIKRIITDMKQIVIIGGGLGGLVAAIRLAKVGIHATVVEKKSYPFHRVCGEYISNETIPYLKSLDLFPQQFAPPAITRFLLSSVGGKKEILNLDLGGFGISRYTFDHFLYEKAKSLGVHFLLNTEVDDVTFSDNSFHIKTRSKNLEADIVLGSFGKRSKLDVQLGRNFIQKRSPYVGVKYHLKTSHPEDIIALHNFDGGYCGMSNIEDGKTTLCYLTHRDNLRQFKNIREMEENILFKNPLLKSVFANSDFLFDKPETINEISFETKSAIENHMLMVGDAAGMITPLCGNGMAMAIHASKLATDLIIEFSNNSISRDEMERNYSTLWQKNFGARLWRGRQIQKLFGSPFASNIAINLALHVKPIAIGIMRSTHGDGF
jgi:flavin-dependent dehydrogenase